MAVTTYQSKGRNHIRYINRLAHNIWESCGYKDELWNFCLWKALKNHRQYLTNGEEINNLIEKRKNQNSILVTQKTYEEWACLWDSCHSPKDVKDYSTVMSWAKWVESMIGPDNCIGFLIRDRRSHLKDLFLSDGINLFVEFVYQATIYTWNDTAVKITNRRSLEAIRIDKNGVAQDSTGLIIYYFNKSDLKKRGISVEEEKN